MITQTLDVGSRPCAGTWSSAGGVGPEATPLSRRGHLESPAPAVDAATASEPGVGGLAGRRPCSRLGAMNLPLGTVRRPRRLRTSERLRAIVRETAVSAADLVLPLFVSENVTERQEVASMPGVGQLTVAEAVLETLAAQADGVGAVLLFGIPTPRTPSASGAYAAKASCKPRSAQKAAAPELLVITDVCLCEYMEPRPLRHRRAAGDGGSFRMLNDPPWSCLRAPRSARARPGRISSRPAT